jgi:hypothetical protein
MSVKKENKVKSADCSAPKLATEGPLCEKDQQALVIESTRQLQKEAQEQWMRFKNRPIL